MDISTDPSGPKTLFLLDGPIKSPPFTEEARREAGFLLRLLQDGESPGMPRSRPMPSIGPHIHEIRVRDEATSWRIIYRIDAEAIIVVSVFPKKTRQTPKEVIRLVRRRLKEFDGRFGLGR